MKLTRVIIISLCFSILVGCQALPKRDPAFSPVQAVDLHPPQQTNGAIYQAGYDMRLFEDHTARRIGDILTVRLAENTKAKKKSDLDASKTSSTSVTAPNILGMNPSLFFGKGLSATLASAHDFQGAGEAKQSNSLDGDISVTVVDVFPNGNLRIRGEKRITLNDGSEYVRLSGIVRPIDIDASNSIPSTKIADATIMYTGDGAVADSNKIGWFSKFFFSPVFPF